MASSLPAAALLIPHAWFALQVRVWHSVSVPGQVAAVRQPTHVPAPSHTEVPPQFVPAVIGGFAGVSPLHTSLVQGLLSTGRSVSSFAGRKAPEFALPFESGFSAALPQDRLLFQDFATEIAERLGGGGRCSGHLRRGLIRDGD